MEGDAQGMISSADAHGSLGCHESGRADQPLAEQLRPDAVERVRDAEVAELDRRARLPTVVDEHVARLEVAVHEAARVGVGERVEQRVRESTTSRNATRLLTK